MDTLEKRVRTLFGGCRKGEIETEQANTEFADIKRGYNKTIEEADEKVALANQMSELVDRYLRRLGLYLYIYNKFLTIQMPIYSLCKLNILFILFFMNENYSV